METLVALIVYFSFVQVATSGLRIIPYSLVMELVCAQMRSDSGISPYSLQHGIVIAVLVTSSDGTRTEQIFTPRINTLEISRCAYSIRLILIPN